MSIILRSVKGSELTFAEVDGNFQSFFYSSSVSGGILNLHFYDNTSQSISLSSVPSISASYAATASYVLQAVSASYASTIASGLNITASNILVTGTASIVYSQIITSSTAFTSGSNLLGASSGDKQTLWGTIDLKSGPLIISGSTTALSSITAPSFTGSLQGTSSWTNNAITASYILNAVSSSYAATASYALNSPASTFATSSLSSSYASSSTSASYAVFATSASYASSSTSASYSTNALSASFSSTASFVQNAVSSSYATFAASAFLATTASYTLYTSLADAAVYANTASFATSSLSASFASTASFVQNAISASYASSSTSASYATNALSASLASTASYVLNAVSSSRSISSSYAITSSYSTYAESANTANSATTAGSATTANVATSATSASYALTAQSAVTASFALSVVGGTFPYTGSAIISGSLTNIGNTILSGSTTVQSSSLTVNTGSLIVNLPYDGVDNTTVATTINRGNNLIPALSVTGSSNFNGALTVSVGTLTAKDDLIVSGSSTFTNGGVTIKNGITITGSTLITGSTTIVGTTTITGSLRVNGIITGSLNGTSSWATRAISSSYISGAISNNVDDYILTATGGGSINGEGNLTFNSGNQLSNNSSAGIIRILDSVNNTQPTAGITSFVNSTELPNALDKYYGETISGTAADSLATGTVIYLTSNVDEWGIADRSNSSIYNLLGICLNNAGIGDPITILLQGFVVTDVFGSYASYQPGLPLYLGTNGRVTDLAPGGGQDRIIGHYYREIIVGTYSIRFNPDNYWV
jgi:hypothetical protein